MYVVVFEEYVCVVCVCCVVWAGTSCVVRVYVLYTVVVTCSSSSSSSSRLIGLVAGEVVVEIEEK